MERANVSESSRAILDFLRMHGDEHDFFKGSYKIERQLDDGRTLEVDYAGSSSAPDWDRLDIILRPGKPFSSGFESMEYCHRGGRFEYLTTKACDNEPTTSTTVIEQDGSGKILSQKTDVSMNDEQPCKHGDEDITMTIVNFPNRYSQEFLELVQKRYEELKLKVLELLEERADTIPDVIL